MQRSVRLFRASHPKSRVQGLITIKSSWGLQHCRCVFCGDLIATGVSMTAAECRAVLSHGHGCAVQVAYESLSNRRIGALNGIGRMTAFVGIGFAASLPLLAGLMAVLGV